MLRFFVKCNGFRRTRESTLPESKRIIELTNQVEALQHRARELAEEIAKVHAGYRRDLVPIPRNNALVVWKPRNQR